MTKFLIVAAIAGLTVSTGALASEGGKPGEAPAAQPAPTATAKAEPKYCVVDTPTGSHIRQKVCKTRSEWISQDGFDPTKG